MNAKRLMMALLAALLISGLATFWLSRRLAKAAHVEPAKTQLIVAANQTLEAGQLLKPPIRVVGVSTNRRLSGFSN